MMSNKYTYLRPGNKAILRVVAAVAVVLGLLNAVTHVAMMRHWVSTTELHWRGKKTVDDRLAEYGQAAKERLAPYFSRAGVHFPPARVDLLALKDSGRLEVYAANANGPMAPITVYQIEAASGRAGPKLAEDDGQVPEGIYPIDSLNPNSLFHLSLRVGYPNTFDLDNAARDHRTNLGGNIMIHGAHVSVGCLAMGNQVAEDLFVLAADTGLPHVRVIISPVDFRKTSTLPSDGNYPSWSSRLYTAIKAAMATLPVANPALPVQSDPTDHWRAEHPRHGSA